MDEAMKFHIGFPELNNSGNFPPHNIERDELGSHYLTMAVAGFTSIDLTVTQDKDKIIVTGGILPLTKEIADLQALAGLPPHTPVDSAKEVIYRGIALREFTREFLVYQMQAISAKLKNGVLTIYLETVGSEAFLPRSHAIRIEETNK